jgi:hypothetical protein
MKNAKIILVISLGLIISLWIVLTKTGLIPNYLGIEILCSQGNNRPLFDYPRDEDILRKPVIYLYPTKTQNVSISIDYPGEIFVTYPKYNNGWDVIAQPDGKLLNTKDGKEYNYLFWEGIDTKESGYDMSVGYVVKGEDTLTFLQNKLAEIGLLPNEYNEFIVYWLPLMIQNKYNIIHFATDTEYAQRVKLNISPSPDSVLRLFMVFKKTDENIEIKPQNIKSFERKGFTVVEWGGTEILK